MAASDGTKETIFVIISDSDGELDNDGSSKTSVNDGRSQFDEFVDCSNGILKKIRDEGTAEKIQKHLLKVFKAAKPDYISSEEFSNTVRQNLTELQKPDVKDQTVFSVVHDVVIHLKNAKKTKTKSETEINKDNVSNGSTKTDTVDQEAASTNHETFSPCGSEPDVTHAEPVQEKLPIDNQDVSDVAQTREGKQAAECRDQPSGSKDNSSAQEPDGVDKARRHKIRRMEKLMGRLDKEIHRYSEKELTLEEMAKDDSSHMIEHRLRTRFVEAWRKWCKLKGYEAKTGRGTEKKVKFEGTRYPEINLKIRKLIKHNNFPDFHDVYEVIERTNQVKNLGIHKFDLRPLATEVFKDVGEKLSKRRINDDIYNAGYASMINTPDDPANENPELRNRLEENATKGREMMDKVLEKYTHMARELHPPGVEPEFDRTSDPEIAESEEEEGDWIECDSDSDESQSEEPSGSPEAEATKMETNGVEDSKKRPLEEDSVDHTCISVNKKMKVDPSQEKSYVAVNGLTNESQTIPNPPLQIVKVESLQPSISMKPSSVSKQVHSQCKPTQNAAGPPQNKSLATRNLQQTQHQQKHVALSLSKKELGDSMASMKPLQLVKGGIKLLHGNPSNVVPSSTRSLPMKTTSHRTQVNSLSSVNNKVPSRRIQLNSFPSTSNVSATTNKLPSARMQLSKRESTPSFTSTMNKPPSARMQLGKPVSTFNLASSMSKPMSARKQLGPSTHHATSSMNKPPSVKMQLGKQASALNVASMKKPMSARKQLIGTSTHIGIASPKKKPVPPVQVSSNKTQINGNVVKVTQIFIPNQFGTRRQDVVCKKNFTQNTQSNQSNGEQKSYDDDDDDIIILD